MDPLGPMAGEPLVLVLTGIVVVTLITVMVIVAAAAIKYLRRARR